MKRSSQSLRMLFSLCALLSTSAMAQSPVSGCGNKVFTTGSHSLAHEGIQRNYKVYLPASYEANVPAPVVFYFHGWGGDENEFVDNLAIRTEADRRGYILVAPRGLGAGPPDNRLNSWSFQGSSTGLDGDGLNRGVAGDSESVCDADITPDYGYPSCAQTRQNTCSWTQCQADDVAFVRALVAVIQSNLCIDTWRIFAMGGSNGGMFTWELGQNPASAEAFRALASVIGLPHRGYLDGPGKSTGLPMLLITGTRDKVVPPGAWDDPSFTTTSNENDRFYYTGATAIVQSWSDALGCDVSTRSEPFDVGYPEVDCRTYCNTASGWPRVLDCRADMGHEYRYSWSWKLVLDFFDSQSVTEPTAQHEP